MAYSYQEVVSNGSLTTLGISIGFTSQYDITVLYDGVLIPTGTNVGQNWVWSDDKIVTFRVGTTPTPIPNGVVVRVERNTDVEVIRHVFSVQAGGGGSAKFTNSTMDENFQQFLYTAQESVDRTDAAIAASSAAVIASNTAINTADNALDVAEGIEGKADTAMADAAAAVLTANAASTAAGNAVTTANTANTAANAANTTANTASTAAAAANTTAGNALTAANSAVDIANAAGITAGNAVTTANAANTTAGTANITANAANTASANAVTTANTANTNASEALTTANGIAGTANTALSNSTTALSTANTANTNASNAVDIANGIASTANTALDNANAAVVTANAAAGSVGGKVDRTGDTFTGKLVTKASAAAGAGFNIPVGVAPTTPVAGDMWMTGTALVVRNNTTTKTLAATDNWTVPTQAEVEAGTATTARVITAQRIRQAIAAAPVPASVLAALDEKVSYNVPLDNSVVTTSYAQYTSGLLAFVSGGAFADWRERPSATVVEMYARNAAYSGIKWVRQGDKYAAALQSIIHTDGACELVMAIEGVSDTPFSFNGSTGAAYAVGTWNAGSDRRLKENIVPVSSVLAAIQNWKPSIYRKFDKLELGLIAQEVQETLPVLVTNQGTTQLKDGTTVQDTLALNYGGVAAVAIGAINALHAIVKQQALQITALESRISALEQLTT